MLKIFHNCCFFHFLQSIFRVMKPGALIFFVDNAAGGFHEMVSQTAKECGMKSVFEPLRHYHYKEEAFRREYCSWISQYEARVTVEVWEKTETLPWNTTHELRRQFYHQTQRLVDATFTDEDFPAFPPRIPGGYSPDRYELQSARPTPLQVESASEMENNQRCCTIM